MIRPNVPRRARSSAEAGRPVANASPATTAPTISALIIWMLLSAAVARPERVVSLS
ncbi:MAG: hypothetical protein ACRD0A_17905 [Acidimicrobiales bacterium]